MTAVETERAAMIADSLAHRDVIDRLHAEGLTDGLPVIPPTAARVQIMLAGRNPMHVLGLIPPLSRPVDMRALAICAVLAGCQPQEFSALVTASTALMDPQLNLLGVATTTGNTAVGMILHPGLADQLEANAGANTFGPGNRVNASLGRSLALVVRLIGGAQPGSIDMATIGQPAKFGCCLAERQPPAPWQSLPIRRELKDTFAVSVFATSGVVEVADTWSSTGRGLLETLAAAVPLPTALGRGGTQLGGGEIVALIPPEWAQKLVDDGWSQDEVAAFVYEQSAFPVERIPPALRAQVQTEKVLMSASTPDDVTVLVAGGVGTKAALLPSWPGGSHSVTRAIESE